MNLNFDIRTLVVGFLAILISLVVHEFAHAWMAYRLGDDTAARQGRLTLNPLVIMREYPIGAVVAPLLGAMSGFLFGWAATPVDIRRVRRDVDQRKAAFLISIAGPVSNVLLAALSVGLYAIFVRQGAWAQPLVHLTVMLAIANVIFAVFNMLPIPPLDGFTVLASRAPASWAPALQFMQQWSLMLFLALIMFGGRIFAPFLGLIQALLIAVR